LVLCTPAAPPVLLKCLLHAPDPARGELRVNANGSSSAVYTELVRHLRIPSTRHPSRISFLLRTGDRPFHNHVLSSETNVRA
jgi:hypothetical protein